MLPVNESERRNQWKKVYQQIKVILNELDPLGVGGVPEDEYDDLNFRIYAQLLVDRGDSQVRSTIRNMIAEDYGLMISEHDLDETVKKLKNIQIDQ